MEYFCLGTENFVDVPDSDVDFKSPIDEFLMTTMRNNDRFNKCKAEEALLSGGGNIEFKVNGNFNVLSLGSSPDNGKNLDGGFISDPLTLTRCALFVLNQGDGGNMVFDIKRSVYTQIPIWQIKNIFEANTQSVARGSAALSTQTIVNAEATQDSQLVDFAYPQIDIENIQQIQGASLFRINFDPDTVELDSEVWAVGKYVILSGANNAGNDGIFEIRRLNECGGVNVVVENLTGVSEIPTNATARPNFAKYFFTSAIPNDFVPGEKAVFAGHEDATNDGTFEMFRVNEAGNNIVVAKTTVAVVPQAIVQGSVDSLRWKYSFLNNVNDAFAIGEDAVFSGHTDLNNDGSFEILRKNEDSGFNIIVYNELGVAQPGISGDANTNRFVYALDSDPDGFFIIGDTAVMAGHSDAPNDGEFELVDVKYLGNNNVVVYNPLGVEQLVAGGTVEHLQKAILFREDQSSNFEAGQSLASVDDTADVANEGEYLIVDQNRAAISQFNIIVEMPAFVEQLGDAGCITKETRSIFNDGEQTVLVEQDQQVEVFENNINSSVLAENTILSLDVTEAPNNLNTISVVVQ